MYVRKADAKPNYKNRNIKIRQHSSQDDK